MRHALPLVALALLAALPSGLTAASPAESCGAATDGLRAADDLRPFYPDNAVAVLTVDVKAVTASPFGKKVFGADPPFTAARKLVGVLLPDGAIDVPENTRTHLAGLANKLERVTFVATAEPKGFLKLGLVTLLEGPNTEDDYVKALEGYAKAEGQTLGSEVRGGRRRLHLDGWGHGAAASKSLFVLSDKEELVADVLDKLDGKAKPFVNKELNDAVGKMEPADTPVWLAVADEELGTAVATLALKGDAEFRFRYTGKHAALIRTLAESVLAELAGRDTRQGKVWAAAKIAVKVDGDTVTASGAFPAKLLADEYAKQK